MSGTKKIDWLFQLEVSIKMTSKEARQSPLFQYIESQAGQLVRHICNNTLCQNPSHLILGSAYDNMQDKVKSGNSMRGSRHANSKLKESDIYKINEMWHNGTKVSQIALFLNINRATINGIVHNRSWTWLGLNWDKNKEK